MSPEEELSRARDVEMLLANSYIKEALERIPATLIEQWRSTPVKDVELREKIWAIYCGAKAFEGVLREFVESGKMAAIQVEQNKRSWADRAKAAFG